MFKNVQKDILDVGVVILLPDYLNDQVNRATQQIHQLDQSTALSNIPHISLVQGCIDKANIKNLKNKIVDICDQYFTFSVDNVLPLKKMVDHSVWMPIVLDKNLQILMQSVLSAINDCRDPHKLLNSVRDGIKNNNFNDTLLQEIKKNGTPCAGQYFQPHVIVAYKINHQEKIAQQLLTNSFGLTQESFPVDSIGIYQLGDAGNLVKELFFIRLESDAAKPS